MNRQYLAKFGAAGNRDRQPQTAPTIVQHCYIASRSLPKGSNSSDIETSIMTRYRQVLL